MRRPRSIGILVVTTVGVVMLIASTWVQARLVWNFTPSVPVGLYSIKERDWVRGDRVALKPTGQLQETLRTAGVLKEGRLLMKRVAATAGDEVCRSGQQVTINGVVTVTARSGERLPAWSGCIGLKTGDVFLLGETENSFDGRYFGVTSANDIVGPLQPLLTF